jgi:hypothetical protein
MSRSLRPRPFALVCLSVLGALAVGSADDAHAQGAPPQARPTPPANPPNAGPAAPSAPSASGGAAVRSTAQDREDVAITVYNQNFGLVREVRNVGIGQGRVQLELRDVAANIQPETVHVRGLVGPATAFNVLEQNYRFDLLTPQKLLEKFVGRGVKVYRYNERTGKEDAFDAEVLSVADGTVLRIGNEVTSNYPGRIAFPELPANLIPKPTLLWTVASTQPRQKIEVTYLTQNLNWKADYVFVLNESDTAGDLTGWVTLTNQSGAAYENAKLKLVAGDVQRVREQMMEKGYAPPMARAASAPAPQFREESFFEYHLYTLERPTTILDNEQKQVTLLESSGIKIDKKLIFFGAEHYFRGNYGQLESNKKVGVYLDIQNTQANRLGMPLPKGIVRVYKQDRAGARQFVGEDSIDHTPRDERVRIKMGEAFDVLADRKQMDWRQLGPCGNESAWEVTVKNRKDTAVDVELNEPVGGEWEVVSSSLPTTKKDARTFTVDVRLKPRSETKVQYRVRVRWC